MEKKKVLLIAFNNLGKGGIQNQLIYILRNLHKEFQFYVVVWDRAKTFYDDEIKQYAEIIECYRTEKMRHIRQKADAFIRYNDIKNFIKKTAREYGPFDVVHCNNAFDAAPCLEAAKEIGIPVRISHAHNVENPQMKEKATYPLYCLLYEVQRHIIRKNATKMLACSRQVADYFFGKGYGEVLNVGVDLSSFQENSYENLQRKRFELLHVGNMSYQKNQLFLIDMMYDLTKKNKNVHLSLIGGGNDYLQKVRNKVLELNLGDYIDIMPVDSNIPMAMQRADLFLMPSSFEGFGIVLIEAQASGLSCIASDVVSREANCGGIVYLPLKIGACGWSNAIIQHMESSGSKRYDYDVNRFSDKEMTNSLRSIYLGCK